MAKFTYDIGYMGIVAIGDASQVTGSGEFDLTGTTVVLASGGNINVQQTPMFSSGVWGAGWYNAAQQVAYAPNFVTLTGSVNYQLTKGNVFDILQQFAFTDRANPTGYRVYILPNGTAGYGGNSWCESMSFSASQDALVTGDFGFKSGNVKSGSRLNTPGVLTGDNTTYTDDNVKLGASGGNLRDNLELLSVYPFWASGVRVDSDSLASLDREEENIVEPTKGATMTALPDVMDWNASYSSQVVLAKLCSGANVSKTEDSIQADYAALGTMSADGSFTMFGINKQLNPKKIRQCKKCDILIGSAEQPAIKDIIGFGAVIFQSGSTDIQTGSSFTQTSFNFTALGDGEKPVMYLEKEGYTVPTA